MLRVKVIENYNVILHILDQIKSALMICLTLLGEVLVD